jgi:hypothetical protein
MPHDFQEIMPTVFLDTNALVFLWSYITKARELSLPPYTSDPVEYENISSRLKEILPDSITGFYMKGCQSLAYIQERIARKEDGEIGAHIYTSRLSKVELLNGALDGKAHILMAQQGIPYRMRQRSSNLSDLISMRLQQADVSEVVSNMNDVFTLLYEQDDVVIEFVEDKYQADNIARLAEFLSSHFYLDVIDIWMYSCALTIQADQVLCFDDYFSRVINGMNNGANKWVDLRKEIGIYIKQMYGWNKVVFPRSSNIPKVVPHSWNLD